MKKIFAGIVIIVMAGSICMIAEKEFYLKIDLLEREVSKDSNSRHYIVKVENGKIEYEYRYRGFPDNKERSVNQILSEEKLKEIVRYIKKKRIDRSVTEISDKKAEGPSIKVSLSMKLIMDGETFKTGISGNYRLFGRNLKTKGKIIENIDYIDNIISLISIIKPGNHLR